MAVNIPINLEPTLDKSALSILDKQISDIRKDLTDVSKIKLGDEKGFADAYAKRQKAVEELTVALQALKQVSDSIGNKISMGDTSGLRSDIQTLQELKGIILDIDSLLNDARSISLPTTNISAITEDSVRLNNAMQGITSALRSTREASDVAFTGMQSRLDSLKSGFYKLGQIIGTSLRDSLSQSWSILKKYFGLIKSGFTSLFNHIKKGFSAKDTTSGIGNLINQLKSLLGVFALTRLTKSMMSLTNEAINMEGTLNNVFEDSSSAIRDWSNEFADRFTLTIQQARSFATQFGGVLQNLGITGGTQTSMAENLTALSGDFASFYGTSVSDAADRLQAAITGQTRGLKALGIQMNDTLLSQFALNRGYQQAYSAMSEQNKAIVRYNYLLAQTVTQQGNAATSSMGWTNQVRMLKQQLSTLGSVIGGGFVKLLYPVVQVLNKILYAVNVVAQKIAKLFGFDVQSVGEYLGVDNVGGISDASDAINEEADALDNAGKAAKKASKGLASFDKLNNQTSESASGASGGIGGGGIGGLIDADSYFENIPDVNKGNKFLDWLNELYDLLSNKQWEKAGEHVASGINAISDSLYDMLKGDKLEKKIHSFNDGLTDFFKGLLKIDTNKIGKNVGAVINKITYTLTDLYKQLSGKGILKGAGKKISQFFNGLFDEVDFRQLGQTLMLKFSTVFEVLRGFLDDAKESDLGTKLGTSIKNLILGVLDMIDPDEVGSSLGDLLNLGFDALIGLLGGSDGESLGAKIGGKIIDILNKAIHTIDASKMQKAFSSILNFFGDLLGSFGNFDTKDLAGKITGTINGAIEDGSVSNLVEGITIFLGKLVELFGQVIIGIDWLPLIGAIISGIGSALTSGELDLTPVLVGLAGLFGINFVKNLISNAIFTRNTQGLATSIGQEVANAIGGNINSDANAALVTGAEGGTSGLMGLLGRLKSASIIAFCTACGISIASAVTAAITDQFNEYEKNDTFNKELQTLFDTESNKKVFTVLNASFEDLDSYMKSLDATTIAYNNTTKDLGSGYKSISAAVDTYRVYLKALEEQGLSNTDAFEMLSAQIDEFDENIGKGSGLDAMQDQLRLIIAAADDCQIPINQTKNALSSLNETDLSIVGEKFHEFKEGMKWNETELQGVIDTAKRDGGYIAEAYINGQKQVIETDFSTNEAWTSKMQADGQALIIKAMEYGKSAGNSSVEEYNAVITTDETTGQALLNLADANYTEFTTKAITYMHDAGKMSNEEFAQAIEANQNLSIVKMSAKYMPETVAEGIEDGSGDVEEAAEGVVVDAATAAKAEAIEGGKEVSEEYVKQVVETINTDTSIQTAVADNITKSANEAKDEAKAGGETLADEYIKAFKDKITSDTTMKADALKKLKEVLSSLVSDIKSGSKEIGLAIIDGIIDGVNNNAYKLTNKMKELAKSALKSAKDELDIHSPSRVFRDQIGQNIVLGLVEGISDEEIAVQDEMQNIRNIMMQPFETRDMSKYFDFSGINDVIINPSVNKAKLASGLAMEQSTQGILGSLASLGNKTNKLANGTTVINVYLDKDNKLDTYIVDAVNKNTVKGGGF